MIATPVPGAGRAPQAGLTLLQDLLPDLPLQAGERVRAWVADVSGDLALLVLGGRQVRARTEVPLRPGQSLLLEVRRTEPQVLLRPVAARPAADVAAGPAWGHAEQAVRRALVSLRRPLDPQAVGALTAVVRRFPAAQQEAAAAAAAWLHATGASVTFEEVLNLTRAGEPPAPWSLAVRLRALADRLAAAARAAAGRGVGDSTPLLALAGQLRAWGWRPPEDGQPPGHVGAQRGGPAPEPLPGEAPAATDLPAVLARAEALLSGEAAGAAGRQASELLGEIRAILRAVSGGARADIPAPLVVPLPVLHPHLGDEVVVVRKRDGKRRVSAGESEAEVELFLTTPSLGPLRIRVRRADTVSVTVVAADPGARDWLDAALPDLRQGLSGRGLRPGRLEATLGDAAPPSLVPAPAAGLPPGLDRRV
ncbi:flagellar hook-length control protein FliK [Caldinitratiruptor microaerophilus]|uniref:Flagellar hook-length control protein-like C-terminal domain-containing protein n=1 Tax=Caldinitratiruptor microaerophilus TaxID=671077 RepID=A0AA35CLP8_9FIRM|nr:flagellar hook-length control protein FliK [Caldinitratiruptor microaerophilus]BDG61635.1 hypothetical protein caldi_27250 [Caldinitratiruptor microaerophilus]